MQRSYGIMLIEDTTSCKLSSSLIEKGEIKFGCILCHGDNEVIKLLIFLRESTPVNKLKPVANEDI